MQEMILEGEPLSGGIVLGKPFFLKKEKKKVPEFSIAKHEVDQEVGRFQNAINSAKKELELLQQLTFQDSSDVKAILDTHIELLNDPLITTAIEDKIRKSCKNAESIFFKEMTLYQKRMEATSTFFRERAWDVADVSDRVLNHLRPFKKIDLTDVEKGSILFAQEIPPSLIASIMKEEIIGLVSDAGGLSSHAAIIARAKGIPFIGNVPIEKLQGLSIDEAVLDGSRGLVILNPGMKTKEEYRKKGEAFKDASLLLEKERPFDVETVDGYAVNILGNLESVDDLSLLFEQGASGVGLFRSEYLFLMHNRFPTEEEQFSIYKQILTESSGQPAIIRVFDVGGDKKIEGMQEKGLFHAELNPVLGCRAIRFLLKHEAILKTQLRALLRASVYGNLHILIPMVSDLFEIRKVQALIRGIQEDLLKEGLPFQKNVPLGCMIEVPSSAIMCDAIIQEVDFFSVGTNDLGQYVVAVDRTNPHLDDLYSAAHPSILRLLKMLITAANKQRKKLIVCGEIASDIRFISLLLGLGIKEFSVGVRNIAKVKHKIRKTRIVEAYLFAEEALQFVSAPDLYAFLKQNHTIYQK